MKVQNITVTAEDYRNFGLEPAAKRAEQLIIPQIIEALDNDNVKVKILNRSGNVLNLEVNIKFAG